MRYALMVVGLLSGAVSSVSTASVDVSVGIALPGVSIGINLPAYPELVLVPGYPVYYASQLEENYFFYDGVYWVFAGDNWYVSNWYNGPWDYVSPDYVPLFVLRIPVYYYRRPPVYFHAWRSEAPPRWGEHWGNDWERQHSGWSQWNHRSMPAPAPLPVYQRQYTGDHYPRAEQQPQLHDKYYRYQPHDTAVQQQQQRRQEQRNQPDQRDFSQQQSQQRVLQVDQLQQNQQPQDQQQGTMQQRTMQPYRLPSPLPGNLPDQRTLSQPERHQDYPGSAPHVTYPQQNPDGRYQIQSSPQRVEPANEQHQGRVVKPKGKQAEKSSSAKEQGGSDDHGRQGGGRSHKQE